MKKTTKWNEENKWEDGGKYACIGVTIAWIAGMIFLAILPFL